MLTDHRDRKELQDLPDLKVFKDLSASKDKLVFRDPQDHKVFKVKLDLLDLREIKVIVEKDLKLNKSLIQ